MYPDSGFAVPISSFQFPVSVPGVDPDGSPLVGVYFNVAWLGYVVGALQQLVLQSTWSVMSPAELDTVQGQAMTLLYLFSLASVPPKPSLVGSGGVSEELMIRQDPDNPCLLQSSIDGVNWCTFADLSKCFSGGPQPGGGSPQPSPNGGVQQYCATLQANGLLLLPTQVSTGDAIQIVSADGAGWDGNETILGGPLYRCPNGQLFFAGDCTPGTELVRGSPDPVPTAYHMQLVFQINGAFYPASFSSPFIVPAGVSNAAVTLQVNDSPITDNQGSYNVCTSVTNNQQGTWQQTFNFKVAPGPFTAMNVGTGPYSVWVAGQGWTRETTLNVNNYIDCTFPVRGITRIVATMETDCTCGTSEGSVVLYGGTPTVVGTTYFRDNTINCAPGGTIDHLAPVSTGDIQCAANNGTGAYMNWTSVSIYGVGTNPFA